MELGKQHTTYGKTATSVGRDAWLPRIALLLCLFLLMGCSPQRNYESLLMLADIVAADAPSRLKVTTPPPVRQPVSFVLLVPLLATGAGAAWYWLRSEELGAGNVLPYFGFQLYALLAILLLMRFPSRYTHGEHIYGVMLLYGAALASELLDRHIFALGGIVSGHTLKHLLAAMAAYQVVRMLRLRMRI